MARKLLLADDSVTAQNMGRKILTDAGYEVVTVNNGSAALEQIAESKPTVAVLDVYMPGYSGLEVCARIKEGRDTSGITVLLTVGKLEPFRQEEVRKVHADAFIIKPFEASELLAALGKLESKTGAPQEEKTAGQAKNSVEPKAKKHAPPTMARSEREVADGAPQLGDQESGWKARLTVPSPGFKREQAEEEPKIAAISSKPRHFDRDSNDHPAFSVTPSSPAVGSSNSLAGRPDDVTPHELTAVATRAAAVGDRNGKADFERPTESKSYHAEPVIFAGESAPAQHETAFPGVGASEGPVSPPVDAVFTPPASSSSAKAPTAISPVPKSTAAVIAASDSASMAVGARWVAEEIPVEPAESALVLEQEMQNAISAVATAGLGSSNEPGPLDKKDEPAFASVAPPPIGAPTPFGESTQGGSGLKPDAETVARGAEKSASGAGAESSSSEISRPRVPAFAPIVQDETKDDETKDAVVAFEPHPFGTAETVQAAVTQSGHPAESTLEIAASVGRAPTETAAPQDGWPDPHQPASNSPNSGGTGNDPPLEDFNSGKGTGSTRKLENKLDSAAMAAAASGDSPASSSPDATLSSIIDNMLAELKPKLMAELAKKLEKK